MNARLSSILSALPPSNNEMQSSMETTINLKGFCRKDFDVLLISHVVSYY